MKKIISYIILLTLVTCQLPISSLHARAASVPFAEVQSDQSTQLKPKDEAEQPDIIQRTRDFLRRRWRLVAAAAAAAVVVGAVAYKKELLPWQKDETPPPAQDLAEQTETAAPEAPVRKPVTDPDAATTPGASPATAPSGPEPEAPTAQLESDPIVIDSFTSLHSYFTEKLGGVDVRNDQRLEQIYEQTGDFQLPRNLPDFHRHIEELVVRRLERGDERSAAEVMQAVTQEDLPRVHLSEEEIRRIAKNLTQQLHTDFWRENEFGKYGNHPMYKNFPKLLINELNEPHGPNPDISS